MFGLILKQAIHAITGGRPMQVRFDVERRAVVVTGQGGKEQELDFDELERQINNAISN